jgi:ABC-type bacteriocin/lantibiotic exporter with double-glycine peptidase domain
LRAVGAVYREQQGDLTTRTVDIVEGLRVLNGIGGKDMYAQRYQSDSQRLRAEGFRVGAVSSWIPALGVGLPLVFLAVVTWVAARMAEAHTISIGDLVAVYGFVAVLVVPVAEFIENCSYLSQAVVAARRVIGVLSVRPAEHATGAAPEGPAELCDPCSGVDVAVGRLTALVAARPEDAVDVVDRLGAFRPSEATWGGIPLRDMDIAHVRERILVADNEADIFTGTVREVIGGRFDPADSTIARVLRVAAAEDIVDGLPAGLASTVAPQARDLSGGQRQRIRLARVLLAEPEVLLAVEPTSAVDAHTEATIAARLAADRAGRTTVVTTTSPLLLDRADIVHYLVAGRVAATGTHRELLDREPGYRALVSRGLDEAVG